MSNTRNYLLIGAGGTGSYLFPALMRYLETHSRTSEEEFSLSVIDGKEVNAEKLERQLFSRQYIAVNKAEALVAQYEADPNVIIAIPKYLGKKDMNGINEHDVILIAADNWPIRGYIEKRCKQLDNVTVINGGNELIDGSMQLWLRRGGEDITPPLSQGHPEILRKGEDMAELSCEQIAALPGGGQTIIANMQSATLMLNALRHLHSWEANPLGGPSTWNEVFFDLQTNSMRSASR